MAPPQGLRPCGWVGAGSTSVAPWQRISGLAFHLKRAFLSDVNNGQHVRVYVFNKEFTVVFTFKKRRISKQFLFGL